jgi:hypothetical protein
MKYAGMQGMVGASVRGVCASYGGCTHSPPCLLPLPTAAPLHACPAARARCHGYARAVVPVSTHFLVKCPCTTLSSRAQLKVSERGPL